MKPLKGVSTHQPMGPSYSDSGGNNVFLSAAQLAHLANVRPQDVQYWARKGYLSAGEKDGGSQYQLSQLPKAQLMALFSKRLQIKSAKASQLADDLLRLYVDKPDAFKATIAMVEALESRITEFVSMIVDMDLVSHIGDLLAKKNGKSP